LSAAASSRSLPLLLVPQGGGRPRGRPSRPRQSSAAAPGPLGCLALDAAVGRSTRHTRPSPRRWTLRAGSAPRSATGSCRPCGSGLSAPPACTPYFARVCDFPKPLSVKLAGMLTKGGGRKKKKGSEDARLAEKYACPPSSSAAARVWQVSLEVASAFEAHPFHVYCQCANCLESYPSCLSSCLLPYLLPRMPCRRPRRPGSARTVQTLAFLSCSCSRILAGRFAKEDAEREARNKLKSAVEQHADVWEEKKVKVGPIWVTKRVRKETLADKIRANHLWELGAFLIA
jgi:hypothetical protein